MYNDVPAGLSSDELRQLADLMEAVACQAQVDEAVFLFGDGFRVRASYDPEVERLTVSVLGPHEV